MQDFQKCRSLHCMKGTFPASAFVVAKMAILILFSAAVAGCGARGPDQYTVTGNVTYGGKPIPAGRIFFEPDVTQGNSGAASVADIHAGTYRTRPQKGTHGGAYVVTIYGDDGRQATEAYDPAVFAPYKTVVELPKENCRHDFEVPQSHRQLRPL